MKKPDNKRKQLPENKIKLALYRIRKGYPNLYRDAGARYIRYLLKKVLSNSIAK